MSDDGSADEAAAGRTVPATYVVVWALALAFVVGAMGRAAFAPFERYPDNDLVFDADAGALRFGSTGGAGIARLTQPLALRSQDPDTAPALTVALFVRTAERESDEAHNHGEAMLAVDDGASPALLRLGQKQGFVRLDWREIGHGIRRARYLGRGDSLAAGREHVIAVVTDASGTRITVDGETHPDVDSRSPAFAHRRGADSDAGARVVLGNDATGRVGWRGDLLAWWIGEQALGAAQLERLERTFRAREGSAALRERFPGATSAWDYVDGAATSGVETPSTLADLRRPVLQSDRSPPRGDAIRNLFGFVPLGLVLALTPLGRRRPGLRRFAIAALACCAVSLAIELAQVEFPARYSSLYDWGLNTLGGALGAALAIPIARLLPYWKVAPSDAPSA